MTGATGTHVPRFGVFTDKHPYDGSVAGVDALQAKLGRDIEIVNWYQSWGGGEWISSVQPTSSRPSPTRAARRC